MSDIIKQINELMLTRIYKDISIFDNSFVLWSIQERVKNIGLGNIKEYPIYFEQDQSEADKLNQLLNNSFTQFFRDSLNFSILEKFILPDLIKSKSGNGEIRIWSAGCSTGQEAYSLAILLHEQLGLNSNCHFRIFATDYESSLLDFAKKGVYSKDSMQNVKLKIIDKYFHKSGENYAITSKIRESVVFSYYDLLDKKSKTPPESIYGDFDIIMCSNVMYYYNKAERNLMISKFKKALSNNGYLITGDAENTFIKENNCLIPFNIMTTIHQKQR